MEAEFITFLENFDPKISSVLTDAYKSIFESDYMKTRLDEGERIASIIIDTPPSEMYDNFVGEVNNGFLFDYGEFQLVLFSDNFHAIGQYLMHKNKPNIIMYVLDDYLNQWMTKLSKDWSNQRDTAEKILKSVQVKLKNNRTVIVHEWTHAQDDKANTLVNDKGRIRKPSESKIKNKLEDFKNNAKSDIDSNILRLINSDIEFNAELIAAISEAIRNNKTTNFDEFLDSIIKSAQFKSIYASNKTILIEKLYKKLLKRAYQYYTKYLE